MQQHRAWPWTAWWAKSTAGDLTEKLPDFVQCYYDQLKSDYQAAGLTVPLQDAPTWQDLYMMEQALLRARDENDLRRSAWIVRMRFRNVAGDVAYQQYLNSTPPDPATASRDILLADLENLIRRTYYLMVLLPASENIRQNLLAWAVCVGLAVLALIVLVIIFAHRVQTLSIFGLSLLAGAVGGTMSLIQRVQCLPDADPLLIRLCGMRTIVQTVMIPPLAGAIFAGVMYMIFAGHLLTGSVFPELYNATPPKNQPGISFETFFDRTIATTSKDFALVLVWAFIAGFAERFVPDTINRLTAQRSGDAKAGSTQ